MKKKDKEFVERHLAHLRETASAVDEGLRKSEWDKYQLAGIGTFLANMYSGYESIFRILTESRGIKIAKGEYWHSELLDSAKTEGFAPEEMTATLRGMLGFRHLQMHGYAYMFKEEELRGDSAEAVKSFSIFEKHILEIINEPEPE